MNEILISLLILFGTAFVAAGALGLLRLPDAYNRMHATTKASTLGAAALILAAIWALTSQTGTFSLKLLLTLVFLYATAPVGAHMMSRSAYFIGTPLWEGSVRDDMAGKVQDTPEIE